MLPIRADWISAPNPRIGLWSFQTVVRTGGLGLLLLAPITAMAAPVSPLSPLAPPIPVVVDSLTGTAKVSETLETDSNPLLEAGPHQSMTGSVTSPELLINGNTPDFHTDLDTRIDVNRYDLTNYNSVDGHGIYNGLYSGDRWTLGLGGTFDYDTTRTSEVTGSGINVAGIRHRGLSLTPNTSVNLTPVDQLKLSAGVQDSSYSNSQIYTPYRVYNTDAIYQRAVTSVDAAMATLQGSRYETESGPSITIDTWSPQVGWATSVANTLTLTVLGGLQFSNTENSLKGGATTDQDYAFSVTANYKLLQNTLDLSLSRAPNPQSDGSQTQSNTLALTDTYVIQPRLTASLYAYYQISDYNGASNNGSTVYSVLSPKLSYSLYRGVDLSLSDKYSQSKDTSDRYATSNAVLLGVNLGYDSFDF
jgi:hypothetical protein